VQLQQLLFLCSYVIKVRKVFKKLYTETSV
jgi:hypothetical protein